MSFFPENDIKIEKPLNMALKYLAYRPRTVYEIQEYLNKKNIHKDIVRKIIEFLLEKKYLDDTNFAKLFVESKIKGKAKSKFALQYELKRKGICPIIINDILKRYNDEDLALKSVSKKIKTWQNLDDEKFKKKMMNYLNYRGFSYDTCITTLDYFTRLKERIKENGN